MQTFPAARFLLVFALTAYPGFALQFDAATVQTPSAQQIENATSLGQPIDEIRTQSSSNETRTIETQAQPQQTEGETSVGKPADEVPTQGTSAVETQPQPQQTENAASSEATNTEIPTAYSTETPTSPQVNIATGEARLTMAGISAKYNVRWSAPTAPPNPAQCPEGSSPLQMHVQSQFREDVAIQQYFFWGKTEGTFIEIGAYNGVWMSNSWTLEKYFGWHGLLVEANEHNYKELPTNRPHATVINAAGANGEPHNVTLSIGGGGSSKIKKKGRKTKHSQEIPAFSLETLSKAAGLEKINLLSLDVEGFELDVLKSLGTELLAKLDLLIVENNPGYSQVASFLSDAGFTCVSSTIPEGMKGPNEWWKGPSFSPSQAPEECRSLLSDQVEHRHWAADLDEWLGLGGTCPQFHRVNYNETDLGHSFWVAPPLKPGCTA